MFLFSIEDNVILKCTKIASENLGLLTGRLFQTNNALVMQFEGKRQL